MLARLQQFITLTLFCACAAWATFVLSRGGSAWLACGAAVFVLVAYALVLGLEFVWMFHANHRDTQPGPRPGATVRAWWGEVRSGPRVFCWLQPFRSRAHPDRWCGPPGQRGVVLIHGFVCNRGLWNTWLTRFEHLSIPCAAVNLEPVFGDIDDYASAIGQAVIEMTRQTGCPPVLVAHSMGGLAVRAWMRAHGHALALDAIHQVVTIGTPHAGTALARFGLTTNARQMRRDSEWLRQLAEQEPSDWRGKLTTLYSQCDNIVFPASSAILKGADPLLIPGTAHVHMVEHPLVFKTVTAWLVSASAHPAGVTKANITGPARS